MIFSILKKGRQAVKHTSSNSYKNAVEVCSYVLEEQRFVRLENGLTLISGFSKSLLQIVIGKYTSPYEALIAQLSNPRYECVNTLTTEM